jgi:fatty acid desaturase
MENDTRRGLKATIEDVSPLFRPVLPRTTNDTLLCVNWATVVAGVTAILFAVAGYRGAADWTWLAAVAFAFVCGVLYGVYFEDTDEYDEIEDTDAQRYEHSRDWE